ncbi:MAG: hypothetical protein ACC655_03860 [Rhodothermia bacterium]
MLACSTYLAPHFARKRAQGLIENMNDDWKAVGAHLARYLNPEAYKLRVE